MKALNNIDLKNNELRNAVIQPLSAPPEDPRFGQIYSDNAENKMKWFNGTEWKNLGSSDVPIKNTKTVRFVIGTSTNGWTELDCDYLCDGTDDQVEINAAIQALPSTGGEIKILDGTYNITGSVLMNKGNVKLSGNGISTILYSIQSGFDAISITSEVGNCCVNDLSFIGHQYNEKSSAIYISNSTDNKIFNNFFNGLYDRYIEMRDNSNKNIIYNNLFNADSSYDVSFLNIITASSSSNNIISNNVFINAAKAIILNALSGNNVISSNIFIDMLRMYIEINSDNNIISENICFQESFVDTVYNPIFVLGSNNIVTNNILNKEVYDGSENTTNLIYGNKWDDTTDVVTKDYLDTQLINKVNTEDGKGLSTNDYTNDEKTKLAGIEAGAQVNTIEQISVNGSPLPVSSKQVDITVPTIVTFTATIPVSGWEIYPYSLDGEPFTYWCKIDSNEISSTDNCHITPQYSTLSLLDVPDTQTAFSLIKLAMTQNNQIEFYSDEIPSVDIPILIEVIR